MYWYIGYINKTKCLKLPYRNETKEHEIILEIFKQLNYDIKKHGEKLYIHNNGSLIAILELVEPDPFAGIV